MGRFFACSHLERRFLLVVVMKGQLVSSNAHDLIGSAKKNPKKIDQTNVAREKRAENTFDLSSGFDLKRVESKSFHQDSWKSNRMDSKERNGSFSKRESTSPR